jgi:agmatine/peptidylarginine deiminase
VVPAFVAETTGAPWEDHGGYVLERGNLEVNGAGVALLNWDCQADRNPGLDQAEHEAILKAALGLTQILWAYGHDPADGTTGHIDGYARFLDADTVAIGETSWGKETEDALAEACEAAGLEVVRDARAGGDGLHELARRRRLRCGHGVWGRGGRRQRRGDPERPAPRPRPAHDRRHEPVGVGRRGPLCDE